MLALFKFLPESFVTLVDPRRLNDGWTQENIGFMKGGLEIVQATAAPRDMLDVEWPSTAYGIKVVSRDYVFTGAEAPSYLGEALHRIGQGAMGFGSISWPVVEGAYTFGHPDSAWAVVRFSNSGNNNRALVLLGRRLNLRYTGAWQPSFEGLAEVVVFPNNNDPENPYQEEELRALKVPVKNAVGEPLFTAE